MIAGSISAMTACIETSTSLLEKIPTTLFSIWRERTSRLADLHHFDRQAGDDFRVG